MKKILLGLIVSFTTLSSFAQVDELDSKWMRYMVESERKTVFMQAMDLEASADTVFWGLFNEYNNMTEDYFINFLPYLLESDVFIGLNVVCFRKKYLHTYLHNNSYFVAIPKYNIQKKIKSNTQKLSVKR